MPTTMPPAPAVSPPHPLPGDLMGRGTRSLGYLRHPSLCGIASLALLLAVLGPSCFADTIRVTTWNLEPVPAAGTNDTRVQDAALVLKKLNPDVIVLQQVRDWKMCGQLAQALKPADYNVS